MTETKDPNFPENEERTEMLENIDRLILTREEENILLAFELIKGLGNPTVSHLNMGLAAYKSYGSKNIKQSSKSFLSTFYDKSEWDSFESNQSSEAKPIFKNATYYNIWSLFFQSNIRQWYLALYIKDDGLLPKELQFIEPVHELSLIFENKFCIPKSPILFDKFTTVKSLTISSLNQSIVPKEFLKKFTFTKLKLVNTSIGKSKNSNLRFEGVVDLQLLSVSPVEYTNLNKLSYSITRNISSHPIPLNIDLSNFPDLTSLNIKDIDLDRFNFEKLKDKLTKLTLFSNKRLGFPKKIMICKKLESINLRGFNFETTPKELLDFKEIKNISLFDCKLKQFPKCFYLFSKLGNLDLRANLISNIPKDCLPFNNLKYLHLDANKFRKFPNELALFPQLESLDLGQNQIAVVKIKENTFLKLAHLSLPANQLRYCFSLIENLPKLTTLFLSENKIRTIHWNLIEHFLKNGFLDLSENNLQDLPKIPDNFDILKTTGNIRLENNPIPENTKKEYKYKLHF